MLFNTSVKEQLLRFGVRVPWQCLKRSFPLVMLILFCKHPS